MLVSPGQTPRSLLEHRQNELPRAGFPAPPGAVSAHPFQSSMRIVPLHRWVSLDLTRFRVRGRMR
jgi:hypothetical protein